MRAVLVTRPQPQAGALAARLEREGFAAVIAPLTVYADLQAKIPDLAAFQALVFTSAHGVHVFAEKSPERRLPAFCVGEATAQTAAEEGFENIHDADGDAEDLAVLLRARRDALGLAKILHVSGTHTARDLGKLLEGSGISAESLPVYKTDLVSRLPPEAESALKQGRAAAVLLFSARAASALVNILRGENFRGTSAGLEAVCISGRVAAELSGLPWKAVRVARAPRLEDMLELLQKQDKGTSAALPPLRAEPVIAAFGGLRPLATGLGLTPSTVQGWKKRGIIPEAYLGAILSAAGTRSIDTEKLLKEARQSMTTEKETPERRHNPERRMKRATPDAQGQVHAPGYDGPDRRAADRRAYHESKRRKVWNEKMAFLNRTTLSAGFITAAVLYAFYFMLAPEIAEWDRNAAQVRAMDAQMAALQGQMAQMQKQKPPSLGSQINSKIEAVQGAASDAVAGAVSSVENAVSAVVPADTPAPSAASPAVESLIHLLSNAQALNRTAGGQAALGNALSRLKAALALSAGGDPNPAVSTARLQDQTLDKLLTGVDPKNLGAAAFLLAINELRSHIERGRPFADDLALVEAFSAGNPALLTALAKLAPYAGAGIAGRETLQGEFRADAGDIVMAQYAGGDETLAAAAVKRLSKLVKVRRVDDIKGDSVDATVARAEVLLGNGDVAGASGVLRSLQGPPAAEAAAWLRDAQGYLAAAGTADVLSQTILQTLSSASSSSGFSLSGMLTALQDNLNAPPPDENADASVPYLSPSLQEKPAPPTVPPYEPKQE